MRILEERHPGESWLLWKLGNWTAVPVEWVASIGLAEGYEKEHWTWVPFVTLGRGFEYFSSDALFWNAIIFLRLVFPFGVFLQLRWSADTEKKAYLHLGFGWKLNGRFGVLCRVQSDASGRTGAWSGKTDENWSPEFGHGWVLGHK